MNASDAAALASVSLEREEWARMLSWGNWWGMDALFDVARGGFWEKTSLAIVAGQARLAGTGPKGFGVQTGGQMKAVVLIKVPPKGMSP